LSMMFAYMIIAGLVVLLCSVAGAESKSAVVIENSFIKYEIDSLGRSLHFIDKKTGVDYCSSNAAFASVKKDGKEYPASKVTEANGRITVEFGDSGISAVLLAKNMMNHTLLEVVSVSTEQIDSLMFLNVSLTLKADPKEKFAATAMALNLQTKVNELPGPTNKLQAECLPRFGLKGAQVAILACPIERMRGIMKLIVAAAPDLPHSNVGGPFAMDAVMNRESYILDWDGMTESTVDDWIKVAKKIGIKQFDFNAGVMLRYGDLVPKADMYPKGYESLKNVIDKLHAAGIKAGLHTYACFIAKDSKYVTPIPDPRLAKDATFTLAAPITADASTVVVNESTENMKMTVGFFAGNSVTLQIDDELIVYKGVSKTAPFTFTDCERGAHGTKAVAHSASAKVHHLKEMFFLFAPDHESTMLAEIAHVTADVYNRCGFDMIYLDAIDGMYVLSGAADAWHYASLFTFEIAKNLKRPALMEMSDMHHLFWYVRSRMGAWDVAMRGQKSLVDAHAMSNRVFKQKFLPTQLGWYIVYPWQGVQPERTFPDEIEYLCAKALATDSGLSFWKTFTPESFFKSTDWDRMSGIIRQYEELKLSNHFPESIKKKIAEIGKEFKLEKTPRGKWQFVPVEYSKHKVQGLEGEWKLNNQFSTQPLKVRIEVQKIAAPYDSPDGFTLLDFSKPDELTERTSAENVAAEIAASTAQVKTQSPSGQFTALSSRDGRVGAWTKFKHVLTPEGDFKEPKALGLWVYGDGSGEIINIQLQSPAYVGLATQDHYLTVDFSGWRYFDLIESEGRTIANYEWPYSSRFEDWETKPGPVLNSVYPTYITPLNYGHIEAVSVWYNNLPCGKQVDCFLSPIKALPLRDTKIKNPSITVAGSKIAFPVEMESGSYIEFHSMEDCKIYNRDNELVGTIKPTGNLPALVKGENSVQFICEPLSDSNVRVEVTLITEGVAVK